MTSYPNDPSRTLADSHRRMLYNESGISPGVAAERGYYTARTRSEVPECFADYQRKPGLVIPMFSPDGETFMLSRSELEKQTPTNTVPSASHSQSLPIVREVMQSALEPFVRELGEVREELGRERERRGQAERRVEELERQLEPRESPTPSPQASEGTTPQPEREEAEEPAQRPTGVPWWRRMFGG